MGCTEGMVELFSRETSRFEDTDSRVIKLPRIKFATDYWGINFGRWAAEHINGRYKSIWANKTWAGSCYVGM